MIFVRRIAMTIAAGRRASRRWPGPRGRRCPRSREPKGRGRPPRAAGAGPSSSSPTWPTRGPAASGPPSRPKGPRIVVFGVAGLITLERPLDIQHPFLTLAGQTAPGDGVCIRGESVHINTHDVIIRYLRFRRGNLNVRDDALGGYPVSDIIVDHVSASWGLDENLSLYRWIKEEGGKQLKMPLERVTIQWSITSEALNRFNHAFGGHLGGQSLLVPSQPVRLQHRPQPEHRHERPLRLPQQRDLQLGPPDGRRRRRQLEGQPREQLLQARPGHRGGPPPPDRQDAGPLARATTIRGAGSGTSRGITSTASRRSPRTTGTAGSTTTRPRRPRTRSFPRPPNPRSARESHSRARRSRPRPPRRLRARPRPRRGLAPPPRPGRPPGHRDGPPGPADIQERDHRRPGRRRRLAPLSRRPIPGRFRPRRTPRRLGAVPRTEPRRSLRRLEGLRLATATPRSKNISTGPIRPPSSTTPSPRTTGVP